MVLVHLPTYGFRDARHVFTATNVIPSTHVDSLVQMSPRAILVFRPHVSSSGQIIKFATPVGNYPIWTLARRHGSHRGSHCSHRKIFSKESEIIGLLGRRCKTRLRGAPLFAKFVMICQQNRRGQRAPFLTRGSLLSPIVRSPLHITPVPPFLPFSFRPRTSPHKRQLHQSRLIAVIQPQFVSTKQDLTMPPIPIIAPQPRRLLPQPTIIDTSAPVLPINLDDPFIVSVSCCLCLPYQSTHICLTQVPHTCPQERSASSPHVSYPYSPSCQALSGLSFFHTDD